MGESKRGENATVTVRRPMNRHGTMTVEVDGRNEIRHLVDYDTTQVRSALRDVPIGTTVIVEMRRAGVRSNVWSAQSVVGPVKGDVASSGQTSR